MSSVTSGKLVAKQQRAGAEERHETKGKVAVKAAQLKEFEYEHKTAPGQKKDLRGAMPPAYNPRVIEQSWYEWWEQAGFFHAHTDNEKEKPETYTICLPPPNVTGELHIGHALTCSIQDALIRYNRMRGRETLWIPGTDHAGIATQIVVEAHLQREEGVTRHDLGREKFVQKIWDWVKVKGGRITSQMRRMGASLDWERSVFTLDEKRSHAHDYAFNTLFERGLIYRDVRLTNWDCALRSAVSDIEVDYKEIKGFTNIPVPSAPVPGKTYRFGTMTHFLYPVCEEDGSDVMGPDGKPVLLEIATTRLETMLGDSAVAIHPDDPRYTALHGKYVRHPFHEGRFLPIVLDAELVDMEFGTGVVKVTPAHDPNDFACGKRHGLAFRSMLTDEGYINKEEGAQFAGMFRYDARIAIAKALEEKGLFVKTVPHNMTLGYCTRSKDIIEPLVKPQWYVKCAGMAARAKAAVDEGKLQILPEEFKRVWDEWLGNSRDWCISRQLMWGHQIPAWLFWKREEGETVPARLGGRTEDWIVAMSEEEAIAKAEARLGVGREELRWYRDEDVTDTWFSSGLFPMSTLGWPEKTLDLGRFFPTDVLETGSDILFFWVARMVMLSLELTDKLPFTRVCLHPLVRDAHGKKMSKSLGNVIDPLDVIHGITLADLHKKLESSNLPPSEIARAMKTQKADFPNGIAECGADALRFGLCSYLAAGANKRINLDVNVVVGYRNFCNKIYNATKYALEFAGISSEEGWHPAVLDIPTLCASPLNTLSERYILSKLAGCVERVCYGLDSFDLAGSTQAIYQFFMSCLCDVYIEAIKAVFRDTPTSDRAMHTREVLYTVLDAALRMIHPFMPFVTEELWQHLPRRPDEKAESIMVSDFPTSAVFGVCHNEDAERKMELVLAAVGTARSLKQRHRLGARDKVTAYLLIAETAEPLDEDMLALVGRLAGLESVVPTQTRPAGCVLAVVNPTISILLDIRGLLDIAREVREITGHLSDLATTIAAQEKKLESMAASPKTPQRVLAAEQKKLEDMRARQAQLTAFLAELEEAGK